MLVVRDRDGLVVHAPAKLNLFLEVLGRRPDGFHSLETLMVSVDLWDTLLFKEDPEGKIKLECLNAGTASSLGSDWEAVPEGDDNLVVRAARLLQRHTGCKAGAGIRLQKRIPAAAGLGGGSSDAAAALAGLNQLWKTGLSTEQLSRLAAELGSDVPFFLSPTRAALCRGRGELIEPVQLPAGLPFVVVRPLTGLSTADVYRLCRPAQFPRSARPLVECLKRGRLSEAAGLFHNALLGPAERLNEDVAKVRSALANEPLLGWSLSGSGSALFGLCHSRRQASAIARKLSAAGLGRSFAVTTL